MKKTIISCLAFLFFLPLLKAQTTGHDAEYLGITKEYVLHQDGSVDYHFRKEIRLLTHFSFHRLFGETFIVYNPDFQQLKINESFTVMADGKKVVTPENAFNEVLPGFARDVAAYNHLREMVVTHTGTEIGAVITLDYTLSSAPGFRPFFFGMEEIGESVPVGELKIVVRVPAATPLQYRVLNNRTAPEVSGADGLDSYTWTFTDLPALPHSPAQDPERKAYLQFSAAKDMPWAYFAFVNQPAFQRSTSPGISRRVEAAVKDKTEAVDIALALQDIVVDEIRLTDIPLQYSGYKARTPAEIWQSANATPLEKSVLLAEMLTMAGINASPVATVPNGWFSRDMGNLAVFDGFLVQVNPKKTGRLYLSATRKHSQNFIFDLADKTVILLDAAIETMRTFQEKPETNLLQMNATLKIDREKGLSGKLDLRMEGMVNPYLRLFRDSAYVKSILAGDGAGSVKTKLSQLAELKSRAEANLAATPLKNDLAGFVALDLPRYRSGFDAWNLVQFTSSDNTPVKLEHHLWENYSYQVELPEGWTMVTPPVSLVIKNALGDLEISVQQKGKIVTVKRSWEHSHEVITSDNMDEFREMIVAWERPDWRRIVLKID